MVGQKKSRNDRKVLPSSQAYGLDALELAAYGLGLDSVCLCIVCNTLTVYVCFLGGESGSRLSRESGKTRQVKEKEGLG